MLHKMSIENGKKVTLGSHGEQKNFRDVLPHTGGDNASENSNNISESIDMIIPLPEKRDLCINVTESRYGGKEVKIVIKNLNDPSKNLDLANLIGCPDGRTTHFYLDSKFSADSEANVVTIDANELRDPRYVFAVLHELGHIIDFRNKTRSGKDTLGGLHLKEYADSKYLKKLLQGERAASVEAIKLARKLKKDRVVDFFKLFKTANEFVVWVRENSLRRYEFLLEEKGVRAYSKENVIKKFYDYEAELARKEWEALSEEDRLEINRVSSLI